MIRKLALTASCVAALALVGCSSMSVSKDGYDLSKIDPSVELNKTTLKDLRAMLGTPTFIATEKNNGKVVGFAFVGHNLGAVSAREFGRFMLSMGFAADKWEVTEKVAVFKLDKKGVVTDYQKGGASFLYRSRLTSWNECERKLTPEEINSKAIYSDKQICELYAKEVAAKDGTPVEKGDRGKAFEGCDVACQAGRVGKEHAGKLTNVSTVVTQEEGDGSALIFK